MATTATDSDGRATKRLRRSDADARRCARTLSNCMYLLLTWSSFSSPHLTIVVGEDTNYDAETFYESPDILAQHSKFFAAALRNGWREKEERAVRLPECEPEVFKIFLNFIHSGKFYSSKEGDYQENQTDPRSGFDSEFTRLAYCWVRGESLMSTVFRDAATDALVQKALHDRRWPNDLQYRFYPRSATPNAMSRLLVDMAVWKWRKEAAQNSRDRHAECHEFLGDLALRLFDLSAEDRKGPAPFTKNDCTYHEHVKEDKPCYKTIFHYE